MIDIDKTKNIYMIGIKGVGMTMLAQFLHSLDKKITGSDTTEVFMTDKILADCGIGVSEEFASENIPKNTDLIIYSTAYNEKDNIEVKTALTGKIKTLTYAEALGAIFNQSYGIAVAGSHGKTTTSAWLGFVLDKAGKSPSVMVGSNVPQFGGASISGKSDLLVIEADEYQNKLKHFNPKIALLNNIDYDHPDYFPTQEDYNQVFINFIKRISAKGFLVTNFDDPIIRRMAYVNSKCKVISYGIDESADYVAFDIKENEGVQHFRVKMGVEYSDDEDEMSDSSLGDFQINLIGKHNIYNALAVIATSIELGVDLFTIRKYLGEFEGTTRRMDVMGTYRGATIIDDYAHHPTEIKTTLEAVKKNYKNKNIITVFHPHTFTRTKGFFDDFVNSFESTDELIILDIYGSAREEQGGIHSKDLVKAILKESPDKKVIHISTLEKCTEYLKKEIGNGDVVILMGAGDVFRIGEELIA
ncbi:MAG: UDP-N-acetylmuramate--L-alanine ligase [Patescibacteria group bacterium]|jgi:UDP-N-acetylmuramate--alanine ligase|nr:UDP-N-acetylmuramate--L-alanine ligase [Patescibacteria group bacterium]